MIEDKKTPLAIAVVDKIAANDNFAAFIVLNFPNCYPLYQFNSSSPTEALILINCNFMNYNFYPEAKFDASDDEFSFNSIKFF